MHQFSGAEIAAAALTSRLRTLARSAGDSPRGPGKGVADTEGGVRESVAGSATEEGHTVQATASPSAAAVRGALLLGILARRGGEPS